MMEPVIELLFNVIFVISLPLIVNVFLKGLSAYVLLFILWTIISSCMKLKDVFVYELLFVIVISLMTDPFGFDNMLKFSYNLMI